MCRISKSAARAQGSGGLPFCRVSLFHFALHRPDSLFDLCLNGLEVEARSPLHRRVLDERLGSCVFLQKVGEYSAKCRLPVNFNLTP